MTRTLLVVLTAVAVLAALALPAAADHTDPNAPLTPTPVEGQAGEGGLATGAGTWQHVRSFRGNQASDVTFFDKGGETYAAQGTLGQGPARTAFVGQRIVRLLDEDGRFAPRIRADHGSAACNSPATGVTGLQHDGFATPGDDPELLIDTTDAVGRCHDTAAGGIELIDISGLDDPAFEPREVHLLRFNTNTHTATLDPDRPWIIYSNPSEFAGRNWLEILDIRSCLSASGGGTLPDGASLEERRAGCAPEVFRMPFEDLWTQQTFTEDGEPRGVPAMCHDVVIEDGTMYCSGLNAEVLIDVSGLTNADGDVIGDPLPCTRITEGIPGAGTGAAVTDCRFSTPAEPVGGPSQAERDIAAYDDLGRPAATGWELIGFYNHPGRNDGQGGTNGNTNVEVPADRGVAVSHETRPVPTSDAVDRRFMVVSDERGGGVVPGGASCDSAGFNEIGNGGLHFFDITDPDDITYATMVDADGNESRAVWRGDIVVPRGEFCVVHRFRFLEGEQRAVMGYYSQGIKILDYEIDEQGRFRFTEVASYVLPQANSWTADVFATRDNADGTRTYSIATSDTLGSTPARGMDLLEWTGMPNPIRDPGVPAPERTLQRIAGPDRFGTAVASSRAAFDTADTVFIARADDYADALTGGPLAASQDAPILLTERTRLTGVTEAEVRRLGASRAVLLGGDAAIDEPVAARLRELGLEVTRISGANRFATAALIADELGDDSGTAFLTEGENADPTRGWPDAMSAAPFAAFSGQPILLVNRDRLPEETSAALEGVTETIVVGGAAAVSDGVVAEVREAGHEPRRLSGRNRYETSAAVATEAIEAGMTPAVTWLATGDNFPDALTAGAIVGNRGETLVLVDGTTLDRSPATADLLRERRDEITHVNLLGGTAALSARVAEEVAAILAADTSSEATAVPAGATRGGLPASPIGAEGLALLLAALLLPAAARFGRRRAPGVAL
jgi:putative cell wall-binding protein